MDDEPLRLELVGDGLAERLLEAVAHHQRLLGSATTVETAIAQLDDVIDDARASLEAALRGFDSFDTLAFLHVAVSPGDFADIHESQSQVETSEAAVQVVALTLLSMGLPRTPLTGANSGQPDLSVVLGAAGGIVRAATWRAQLRGRRSTHPLGQLAGLFLGYEISVRGRQYKSIAEQINDVLLGDEVTSRMLASALGFTLHDVRRVREASLTLMDSRLSEARDRFGAAASASITPTADEAERLRDDLNLMLNECRLFGAVTPADVAATAGLEEQLVGAVLEYFSTSRPGAADPDLLQRFVRGRRPTPWGAVCDDGSYLALTGFLGEDEVRRDVERRLKGDKVWPKYDRRRASGSERMTGDAIRQLLGGSAPRWSGQHYVVPDGSSTVSDLGPSAKVAEVARKTVESDLLFIEDGIALCIEVKAGSITDGARAGDENKLATDLQKTLQEANTQAQRLVDLIETNRGVWDEEGHWVDLSSAQEVHSMIVMVDDMGPLSLSMKELVRQQVISTETIPWVVSLHDLLVIAEMIRHPSQFIAYLRRRRDKRFAALMRALDELDTLMWFIGGGMHIDPDPDTVAAQIPLRRPVSSHARRRFDAQADIRVGTLTDPLDAWFYGRDGLSSSTAEKPVRAEHPRLEALLCEFEAKRAPGWLRVGADLVSLDGRGQKDLAKALHRVQRASGTGVAGLKSVSTHGTSLHGSWLFAACSGGDGEPLSDLIGYLRAKRNQTRSSRAMLLVLHSDGRIAQSKYFDEADALPPEGAIGALQPGLYTLDQTFGIKPPSARRSTQRLRGKRSGRRR